MTAPTRPVPGKVRKAPTSGTASLSGPAKTAAAKEKAPAKGKAPATPPTPAKISAQAAGGQTAAVAKAAVATASEAPAAPLAGAAKPEAAAETKAPETKAPETETPETETPETEAPAGGLPESGPVADLLSVMTDMMTLLTEEVQALKHRNPEIIKDLQQRKEYLASAYETYVKSLRADPEPLEALDDAARAELRAATESFDEALRRNGRALAAAHDVAQELLGKTVDIVKDHRRQIGGYSPGGIPRGESERYAAPAAFDRNL